MQNFLTKKNISHIVVLVLALAVLIFSSDEKLVGAIFGDKMANQANGYLSAFDILHGGKDIDKDGGNDESLPATISEIPIYPLGRVIKVIDGDTITVQTRQIEVKEIKIRLIGIDTPETVDPRKPVQCFGIEASRKAGELLDAGTVRLESDPSQGDFDRYGRMLAYVYIQDLTGKGPEVFFNKYMIQEGYAYEYTYDKPYLYQGDFKTAQIEAKSLGKGLWRAGVCEKVI